MSRAHQPVQEVSRAHHTVQTRGCEDWTCMRPTISWTCMEPTTSPLNLRTEHQTYAPSQDSAEGVHRIWQSPTNGASPPQQVPSQRMRLVGGPRSRGIQDAKGHYQPNPQNNTSSSDTDTQAAPAAPLERGAGVGWAMMAGMEQHTTELLG